MAYIGVGDMEMKTETDINDITEYSHDDQPSVGMFVFVHSRQLFVSVCILFQRYFHLNTLCLYVEDECYHLLITQLTFTALTDVSHVLEVSYFVYQ